MTGTTVAIETTRSACAGAASAYALRSLADRAGTYAPGIDERLFFELSRDDPGVDLIEVARWFATRGPELSRRGYRLGTRLVAFPTESITAWVAAGHGFRAAVLSTAADVLHPDARDGGASAVAVVCHGAGAPPMLCDPWPGAPQLRPLPDNLGEAHRRERRRTLLLYWFGYS